MNPQFLSFQLELAYFEEQFLLTVKISSWNFQDNHIIYCNNFANFYQILRQVMSKLASLYTMIITRYTILYIILSLLKATLGYFGAYFGVCFSFFENRLIFSHEILYSCFRYYSDGHYTKDNFSCHVPLGGGHFDIFLGLFLCVIFYFLRTVQYFLMNFLTDF